MPDIEVVLRAAWSRVLPRLLTDPGELALRLERRRTQTITRPVRPFCIGVRANDRRITPWDTIIVPHHVLKRGHYAGHDLTLDKPLLVRLGEPVNVEKVFAHRQRDVAAKLGTSQDTIRRQADRGVLRRERFKGLGGARCSVPLVWAEKPLLDANAGGNFQPPDVIWGSPWQVLAAGLPDDFAQVVRREPKWRADKRFYGWRWVCPACGARVRHLFMPRPIQTIVQYLGDEQRLAPHEADAVPVPLMTFACHDCHRVRYWTGLSDQSWNMLVAYLSGGLLYGNEVDQPAGWKAARKRAYRPHAVGHAKGDAVEKLLLAGKTYQEAADGLGIKLATVQGHVRRLYKRRGVHARRQLVALANAQHNQPDVGRI